MKSIRLLLAALGCALAALVVAGGLVAQEGQPPKADAAKTPAATDKPAEQPPAETVPEPKLSFKLVPAKDMVTVFGPEVKPEDNAAPLYEAAFKVLRPLWDSDDETDHADKLRQEFGQLLVTWGVEEPDPDGPKPGERDPEKARAFLKQFAEALALRDKACAKQYYRRDVDWSQHLMAELVSFSSARALTHLSFLAAAVDCHEGKADSGYNHVAAVLKLSEHLQQETTFISQLLASANRQVAEFCLKSLLHDHPPSAEAAAKLKALLDVEVPMRLRNSVIGEVVLANGAIEDFISGKLDPALLQQMRIENIPDKVQPREVPPEMIVPLRKMRVGYLEFMDRYVKACRGSPKEMIAAFGEIGETISRVARDPKAPNIFIALFAPSWKAYVEALYKDQAQARMMSLAIDIAASRKDATKPYPRSLTRIPMHLILKDPFSDKQFQYKSDGKGFTLWSVGPDGDDDGGKTADELGGDGPSDNGDIVVRIPPKTGD